MLLRLLCLAALAAAVVGCQPRQVNFRLRLDGNADATTVRVRILSGGCSGTPVYSSVFPVSDFEAARTPPVLSPGPYGFEAQTRDGSCLILSTVCLDRELPLEDEALELVLAPQMPPVAACPPAQCMSGECINDDPDAGPPMRDAGDGDAGPRVDAGPIVCSGDGECPGGSCQEMTCCNGCWDGRSCQSGLLRAACGTAGMVCNPCNAGQSCISGACSDAAAVSMAMSATTTFIRGGGDLWSGGSNTKLQRGNLLSATPDVFAQMDTTLSFVDVAVTQTTTCGIDSSQRLYCWGGNGSGLLGVGSGDGAREEATPQSVGSSTWLDVEGGNTHFCAIRADDNSLHCWGINGMGQLGVGGLGGSRNEPTPVDGGGAWIDMSLGDTHTCAINLSQELFCWGSNASAQLGIMGQAMTGTPTRVPTGNEWSEISVGTDHSCGILAGDLFCWGDQSSGRLGDGVTTSTQQPTPILIEGSRPWTQISAGLFHTCAVTMENEVYCWGVSGLYGRLGLGDGVEQSTPTLVTSGFDVVEVGWDTSCAALTTDATLGMTRCWGDGLDGKIGTGRPTADFTPAVPTFEPAP